MQFPAGYLDHLKQAPGFDVESFQLAHSDKVPVSVRIHPRKPAFKTENLEQVKWCNEGFYLPQRPDFTLDPIFHAGAYYVQEASSMSIQKVLEDQFGSERNLRILDLCAAPGGKSTLLASWLNGNGLLVANEVIKPRASILKENLDRWGFTNVVVSNNDPRQFGKLEGFFDVVVVDAPCSGSGMFRKDPEAMKHWSEDAVAHCSARQERILEDVWPALKPGGLLLYSTCSYSESEDEQISQWIAEDLEAEILKSVSLDEIPEIIKTAGGYRFYPNKTKGEGYYLSILRKLEEGEDFEERLKLKNMPLPDALEDMLEAPVEYHMYETHLGQVLFPKASIEGLASILKHLHVLKVGTLAGELKGKSFIPDHELAMSLVLDATVPRLELSKEEALRFLKKEALPNRFGSQGWHLIQFEGLSLGWGNVLPNRINNGLPKSWRILKEIGV
jgi:16S rRNA C967 or C1407 C5-methylase (RsmB/RsmF family)/NOL1/NOP2/fmu family ribosome biogenesis protein